MATIPEYDSSRPNIMWDVDQQLLLQHYSWGYIKPGGMAVITQWLERHVDVRLNMERTLGVTILNPGMGSLPKVWDDQGRKVVWASMPERWWLWDTDHDIVLPQPLYYRSIVYPTPTGRPYLSYHGRDYRRGARPFGVEHSQLDKPKLNAFRNFMKLLRAKAVLIGLDTLRQVQVDHQHVVSYNSPVMAAARGEGALPELDKVPLEVLAALFMARVPYGEFVLADGEAWIKTAVAHLRTPYVTSYLTTRRP